MDFEMLPLTEIDEEYLDEIFGGFEFFVEDDNGHEHVLKIEEMFQ